MLKFAITAVFSALVTSIFWIWFYSSNPNGKVDAAGDVATLSRPGSAPLAIAEALEVGPTHLPRRAPAAVEHTMRSISWLPRARR